jgi:hypothetical protein
MQVMVRDLGQSPLPHVEQASITYLRRALAMSFELAHASRIKSPLLRFAAM